MIGPYVKQRPAAGGVEQGGGGVPELHAARAERRRAARHRADRACIDQPPRALVSRAEKGVGRAADLKTTRCGEIEKRGGIVERRRKRLFEIEMFARLQHAPSDRVMKRRWSEHHDQIDRGARQQRVDRHRLPTILCRAHLGRCHRPACECHEFKVRRARDRAAIGMAHHAAADDADPHAASGGRFVANVRRAARSTSMSAWRAASSR